VLFIQVINPKNNLLGDGDSIEFGDKLLSYSASTKVFYENDELDVCILVNAAEDDLIEGRYVINVFEGGTQIASTTMELK
jgi:hypothetical protein